MNLATQSALLLLNVILPCLGETLGVITDFIWILQVFFQFRYSFCLFINENRVTVQFTCSFLRNPQHRLISLEVFTFQQIGSFVILWSMFICSNITNTCCQLFVKSAVGSETHGNLPVQLQKVKSFRKRQKELIEREQEHNCSHVGPT